MICLRKSLRAGRGDDLQHVLCVVGCTGDHATLRIADDVLLILALDVLLSHVQLGAVPFLLLNVLATLLWDVVHASRVADHVQNGAPLDLQVSLLSRKSVRTS